MTRRTPTLHPHTHNPHLRAVAETITPIEEKVPSKLRVPEKSSLKKGLVVGAALLTTAVAINSVKTGFDGLADQQERPAGYGLDVTPTTKAAVPETKPLPTREMKVMVYTNASPSSIVDNANKFHVFHNDLEKDAAYETLKKQADKGAFILNNMSSEQKFVSFNVAADTEPHYTALPSESIGDIALRAQHLGLVQGTNEAVTKLTSEDGQPGIQSHDNQGETLHFDYPTN